MSRIKFTVVEYDIYDEEFKYRISAVNEIAENSLEFYGYADTFQEFAKGLISFPKSINESIIFQMGEDKGWAYYAFLKVFCYEANGYTVKSF